MKNKKTLKITLLSILAVIVILLAFLCARNWSTIRLVFDWDNIVSFVNSHRYSTKDLETKLDDNKVKMEKIAEESPHINIRGDLTDEERAAFSQGLITKEEAAQIIKGDTTMEEILASREETGDANAPPSDTGKEQETSSKADPPKTDNPPKVTEPPKTDAPKDDGKTNSSDTTPKPDSTDAESSKEPDPPEERDRVSEIIAELYVVQADFISRLEALGDTAYADYKAIHYDRSQIMNIINSYTGTVTAMESECDATVNALLSELTSELNKVGGDQSIVKEIRKFYYEEKSLKKSYYLNKMYDEDYK